VRDSLFTDDPPADVEGMRVTGVAAVRFVGAGVVMQELDQWKLLMN